MTLPTVTVPVAALARARGYRQVVQLHRLAGYGVLMFGFRDGPGQGWRRAFVDGGGLRDLALYDALSGVTVTRTTAGVEKVAAIVAAWRDRGRPRGWVGSADGAATWWPDADAVAEAVGRGVAVIAAYAP